MAVSCVRRSLKFGSLQGKVACVFANLVNQHKTPCQSDDDDLQSTQAIGSLKLIGTPRFAAASTNRL